MKGPQVGSRESAEADHAVATAFRAEARLPWWVPFALGVAALILRLYRIGAQCFWFDEAQTLSVARLPWDEIVQRAYRPPLYHYLLNVWSTLVPESEFWLRLPSALIGALVPPLILAIGTRLYGRRTGLLAGLLAAISPALVAYSQELRMYSLLAFEFALLCWLTIRLLSRAPSRGRTWIAFGLTVIAALYTHYFALPFVLSLGALGMAFLLAERRSERLWRWIAVHALAGLAFVPWLTVILSGRGGTEDYVQAEVSPILAEVPGVPAFLYRVWLFYTTGPTTSDLGLVRILAAAAAIIFMSLSIAFAVATCVRAYRHLSQRSADDLHKADLVLLGLVALPLAAAAVMYGFKPGTVHPRHLMMVAVPFTLLLARTTFWLWGVASAGTSRMLRAGARCGSVLSFSVFATLSVLSLVLYHSDPSLQRPDVRALAERVMTLTGPGDVVLMPYQDYAFEYYFNGPATALFLETRVGDEDLLNWVMPRMQQAGRAVLLRWVHTLADPRDALDWFLEANGRLEARFWQADRWVSVYDLYDSVSLPELAPASATFGPLTLSGVWVPNSQTANETVAIALSWTLSEATTTDLKASVRLVDAAGRVIVADDRFVLAEQAAVATSHWSAGDRARNYYLLEVPRGTPPVNYRIVVTVYQDAGPLLAEQDGRVLGAFLDLGETRLLPSVEFSSALPADPGLIAVGADLADGLTLVAVGPFPASVGPGEPLPVTLYWRASAILPPLEPALVLVDASGTVLAEAGGTPVYGLFPTDLWRPGPVVTEHRVLRTGPGVSPGEATLLVELGDRRVTLGQIQITPTERSFAPVEPDRLIGATIGGLAVLTGADVEPAAISSGGPLSVTLYWEALADSEDTDYVVFVQLLSPDDRVIAQHDGWPSAGRWPTSTWVAGQTIPDRHDLEFRDPDYTGEARVIAGLYDGSTLLRLATDQGEDYVVISPVRIQ